MLDRREFIGALGAPATAALAVGFIDVVRAREAVAALSGRPGTPEEIADDESFWFEVQRAFVTDRSLINLNNGGVSPSPEEIGIHPAANALAIAEALAAVAQKGLPIA